VVSSDSGIVKIQLPNQSRNLFLCGVLRFETVFKLLSVFSATKSEVKSTTKSRPNRREIEHCDTPYCFHILSMDPESRCHVINSASKVEGAAKKQQPFLELGTTIRIKQQTNNMIHGNIIVRKIVPGSKSSKHTRPYSYVRIRNEHKMLSGQQSLYRK
jgi:hypothetical protein